MDLLAKIEFYKKSGKKGLAVLLDPDKVDLTALTDLLLDAYTHKVDFIFVGGSLLAATQVDTLVQFIKKRSTIPVILFPGNVVQISENANAILFLSLVSGRNPEYLIGQHVIAAPLLKQSSLEVLPTGYMLIDGGKPTSVSYISNTSPIPADKPQLAMATALASELLGHKLIYADAGSGALHCISPKMIQSIATSCSLPLIIGGGINTVEKAIDAWIAGADLIVVGTKLENDPNFINQLGQALEQINEQSVSNK
jgi:phosphoglycerol geranylgeranyltransferase